MLVLQTLLALGTGPSSIIVNDVRVTAMSPTLIRLEPKGPQGFEDRTTFMVVSRTAAGKGPPMTTNKTSEGTVLSTPYYSVLVRGDGPPPLPTCTTPSSSIDVTEPIRSDQYPLGFSASDRGACCAACEKDDSCIAFVHVASADGISCWPLKDFASTTGASGREFACSSAQASACAAKLNRNTNCVVTSPTGEELYDSKTSKPGSNLLYWPSPPSHGAKASAYALEDYPRFFTPECEVEEI